MASMLPTTTINIRITKMACQTFPVRNSRIATGHAIRETPMTGSRASTIDNMARNTEFGTPAIQYTTPMAAPWANAMTNVPRNMARIIICTLSR